MTKPIDSTTPALLPAIELMISPAMPATNMPDTDPRDPAPRHSSAGERLVLDAVRLVGAAPSSLWRHASYSVKLPSNQRTWLSPSKARTWVAMRSRNQRSWLMTTAQPGKLSSASSRARSVSTSRSLVGSSSSSTLPPVFSTLARWTRLRSPPERSPTRFCWSLPLKLKLAHVGATVDLAVADLQVLDAAGDLLVHGGVGVERVAGSGRRRPARPCRRSVIDAAVGLPPGR